MISIRRLLFPRTVAEVKCEAFGHDWDNRGHVTIIFDPSWLWMVKWEGESRCLRCSKHYNPNKPEYYPAPECWSHLGKVLEAVAISSELDPRYLKTLKPY